MRIYSAPVVIKATDAADHESDRTRQDRQVRSARARDRRMTGSRNAACVLHTGILMAVLPGGNTVDLKNFVARTGAPDPMVMEQHQTKATVHTSRPLTPA